MTTQTTDTDKASLRFIDIRSIHSIETPEHSFVEIELAGVGNRIFAMLIDLFLMGILWAITLFILLYTGRLGGVLAELGQTLFYLASFFILFGVQFIQEWLWNGQTVGKYLLKIRVVRNMGEPIGFWEAFGRNLFRLIDVWGMAIGLLPMMLSKREKRFGDFIASTLVINNQKMIRPLGSKKWHLPIERPPSEAMDPFLLKLSERLTPEEFDILRHYLARKKDFFDDSKNLLEHNFKTYFKNRLDLSEAMAEDPELLLTLYFGHFDRLLERQETSL